MSKTPKPKTLPEPPAERRLSEEEERLWRHVMGGTEPLAGHEAPPPPAKKGNGGRPPPPPPDLPALDRGVAAGVDKRTATRLRRGQIAIEGRIDLHGLTQEDAYQALSAFLAGSQEAGRRCVLVITGKGLRPDGSVGVIRAALPHWLNQPHNRPRVLAFAGAAPRDGGEGALYVLLRRKR